MLELWTSGALCRRHRLGLRVNAVFESDREVLGFVLDGALRCIFELDAEDERVFLFEPPNVTSLYKEQQPIVGKPVGL